MFDRSEKTDPAIRQPSYSLHRFEEHGRPVSLVFERGQHRGHLADRVHGPTDPDQATGEVEQVESFPQIGGDGHDRESGA